MQVHLRQNFAKKSAKHTIYMNSLMNSESFQIEAHNYSEKNTVFGFIGVYALSHLRITVLRYYLSSTERKVTDMRLLSTGLTPWK